MKKLQLWPLAVLFLTGACGDTGVKEALGIDRRAPDEFRVVSRPPLSVPPQFDLRPPGEGMGLESDTRGKAEALVLGDTQAAPAAKSKSKGKAKDAASVADNLFLQKAGAAQADPNVKKELTDRRVNEQLKKEDASWWSRLSVTGSKEPVVKAEDEAERIRKNQAEGKPVTEGKTPESGGGTMSTLEHWFGGW